MDKRSSLETIYPGILRDHGEHFSGSETISKEILSETR
jgi:hypothetical protein